MEWKNAPQRICINSELELMKEDVLGWKKTPEKICIAWPAYPTPSRPFLFQGLLKNIKSIKSIDVVMKTVFQKTGKTLKVLTVAHKPLFS